MATPIKFGTSGWRAIVADEFTYANVRRAVTGMAEYVSSLPGSHSVLVGRDPRFLGESFVAETARILFAHGITPLVIPEAAPTPAIAYAVREHKAIGLDQLYGVAQSAGVQRDQVFDARWCSGAAGGDASD